MILKYLSHQKFSFFLIIFFIIFYGYHEQTSKTQTFAVISILCREDLALLGLWRFHVSSLRGFWVIQHQMSNKNIKILLWVIIGHDMKCIGLGWVPLKFLSWQKYSFIFMGFFCLHTWYIYMYIQTTANN